MKALASSLGSTLADFSGAYFPGILLFAAVTITISSIVYVISKLSAGEDCRPDGRPHGYEG